MRRHVALEHPRDVVRRRYVKSAGEWVETRQQARLKSDLSPFVLAAELVPPRDYGKLLVEPREVLVNVTRPDYSHVPGPVEIEAKLGRTVDASRELKIFTFADGGRDDAFLSSLGVTDVADVFDVPKRITFGVPRRDIDRRRNAVGDERIIQNVADSIVGVPAHLDWFVDRVREIEERDLECIALRCGNGKHRSVAVAALLKERVYLNATVEHLDSIA